METTQIIFAVSVVTLVTFLSTSIYLEKKRSRKYRRELEELKGQSDEDIYGRGKFSELGVMSAGIVHEISNPLTVIMARIDQMMKKDLTQNPEALANGLKQIRTQSERIAAIIHSVREYIYRNEETVEEFIPLQDIVQNVLVFCGQRLKNHGIEFRLNGVDKVYVTGHKGQYEQAILNLINNSFDAVDHLDEKWIEISAEKSDGLVKIFVKDSGLGIPADICSKMLDPFYSTKKGKGTGLGLTLVRGIAQKHGGDLTYVQGTHTTFMLELPTASTMTYQQ